MGELAQEGRMIGIAIFAIGCAFGYIFCAVLRMYSTDEEWEVVVSELHEESERRIGWRPPHGPVREGSAGGMEGRSE